MSEIRTLKETAVGETLIFGEHNLKGQLDGRVILYEPKKYLELATFKANKPKEFNIYFETWQRSHMTYGPMNQGCNTVDLSSNSLLKIKWSIKVTTL